MSMKPATNRRRFLGAAAVTAASYGRILGANDRIRVAGIGVGSRGEYLLGNVSKIEDTQIVGFCDVYEPHRLRVKARYAATAPDYADHRQILDRKDIDVVDICTPNNTHLEMALAAAANGKMILCEKPLAMNGPEALKMVEAIEKARVPNMVWYNYRRVPAVTLAKKLIDEGRLGKIFHYRAKFLQDWTIKADLPQGVQGLWRLDVAAAGSGAWSVDQFRHGAARATGAYDRRVAAGGGN